MGQGEQARYSRLSIAAIKRLDPFAIEIVDGSDHVAVHTFNDETNEWDKKGKEAAFFVYRRNRRPFHFLLFDYYFEKEEVEQMTPQQKVKTDAPLLFFKNEQNCTRCFRFDTTDECYRIGKLVNQIIQSIRLQSDNDYIENQPGGGVLSMLAQAQKMIDKAVSTDNGVSATQPNQKWKTVPTNTTTASSKVKNFFASGNRSAPKHVPSYKRMLSDPVHVDQIEKQQRFSHPTHLPNPLVSFKQHRLNRSVTHPAKSKPKLVLPTSFSITEDSTSTLSFEVAKMNIAGGGEQHWKPEPLTQNQLLQAMSYLIKNDKDFLTKLHEAYLQSFKDLVQKRT